MARAKVRIKGRFFLIVIALIGITIGVILISNAVKKNGEIQFGSIGATLEVSAAVVRDETVVMTEQYEKVTYNVVEGETVSDGQMIAQIYKRGYQDETMVTLLNLQKEIYSYQMQLLAGAEPAELGTINADIEAVEQQIRDVSRGKSDLDMLTLEQTLKELESQRITLLKSVVTADTTLSGYYAQLETQQATQESWKRNVLNTSGSGIVSFYFDGYEQSLSANKLSTINSALIKKVVNGGNTASNTSSTSDTPLYRIINNTHWFLIFVTKSTQAMRLAAGEEYSVVFTDYSDQMYTAIAREPTVSEDAVVNVLEFTTDIGKLIGVRTVAASISKSAQGLIVPLSAIDVISGVPGVNVSYGESVLRVEVDILAEDEKRAVIRARNASDTLVAGQRFIKP